MKSIRILLFNAFVLCIWMNADAQKRYADLRVTMQKPFEGQRVWSPGMIEFQFSIFNHGPDTLFSYDTLEYAAGHSFLSPPIDRIKRALGQMIAPTDSMTIVDSIAIDGDMYIEKMTFSFAAVPLTYNSDPENRLSPEYWDDRHDNSPSVIVEHLLLSTEDIEENAEQVTIYPNPVTQGKLTVKLPKGTDGSIAVYDFVGRKVLAVSNVSKSQFVLDVSHLHGNFILVARNEKNLVIGREKIIIP